MWVGFKIRDAGKKLAIGSAVLGGAALLTESGRRIARVLIASLKGAGQAAAQEIKSQQNTKR